MFLDSQDEFALKIAQKDTVHLINQWVLYENQQ
jgi:hypothetical protein